MDTKKSYFPTYLDTYMWEAFHTTKYEPGNAEHQEFVSAKSNNLLLYIMSVIGYSKDINIPFNQLIELMDEGVVKQLGWNGEDVYRDIILKHINTDFPIQNF